MARPKAQQFDEINRALSSESVGQFSSAEEAPETIRQLEIAYRQAIIYAEELRGEIKDRKRAEDALERLRRQNELILNSAGEGICGLDLEGNFTFVNPAAARMIGWEPEELISRPQHEVLHHSRPDGSPYPKVGCPTCASLRDEGVHRADGGVFWKKDGTSFPVEYISAPIRGEEGQLLGAVVTFKDITERRAMERMKDEFISVVSHELRTPLTSIRGSLGLLASGMLVTLPEKAQRMADIAVNNTDRLVRLINDILDIERMDSSRATVDKKLCDAADLVAQAAEVMRDMADKAGIGLEVSAQPSELWADPDRIIQALTNLIGNAVKFSPEGATVRLTTRHRDDQVLFQVEDQGRGIPADKLDRVFERFQQVDATDSREKGGTGLGLTICRSIVDQHGGRIWAESAVGEGSTFSFILPAVRQEQPGDSPTTMAGPLVLVCDDDPSVREVMGTTLEHHGFRVLLASSGQEAVELALSRRPHVILLDLIIPRMSSANSTPRMSGWDAMAALSEGPKTRHIPIIIVSGLSAEESAAPSSSVVRWLRKPVDESALLQALKYDSFVERPVRDGPWSARVSGREAPRAVGC